MKKVRMTVEVEVSETEFNSLLQTLLSLSAETKKTEQKQQSTQVKEQKTIPTTPQTEISKSTTPSSTTMEVSDRSEEEADEDCFGSYDSKDPACKTCGIVLDCKKETQLRQRQTESTFDTDEEEEMAVDTKSKRVVSPSKKKPDLSSVPTLKEAVKTLLNAGVENDEEACAIIESQQAELPFDLPDNWRNKVKKLYILLG